MKFIKSRSFNRTIVELKCRRNSHTPAAAKAFNRTIVELKFIIGTLCVVTSIGF